MFKITFEDPKIQKLKMEQLNQYLLANKWEKISENPYLVFECPVKDDYGKSIQIVLPTGNDREDNLRRISEAINLLSVIAQETPYEIIKDIKRVNNLKKAHPVPVLPKQFEKYIEFPYGGLFGRAPIVQVVEEIIADPHSKRTVKETSKLLELPKESVKHVFTVLSGLNIMIHEKKGKKNVYTVNLDSKQVIALTFLAYAVGDDRDKNVNCMDRAIVDYYERYMEKSQK
jgi:hypothetical protein